jgi:predicted HNH restriction endonuclease
MTRRFRPPRRPPHGGAAVKPSVRPSMEELVREAKTARAARAHGYRERSLALHGWICARCAREFETETLHLLTVHHKDGNHEYNPPDGSNWENLCAYCHEAEHTKGLLGDYLTGRDTPPGRS